MTSNYKRQIHIVENVGGKTTEKLHQEGEPNILNA